MLIGCGHAFIIFCGHDFPEFRDRHGITGHQRHISRGAEVALVLFLGILAAGVLKGRIYRAELFCLPVHHLHKIAAGRRDVFGDDIGRLISGFD